MQYVFSCFCYFVHITSIQICNWLQPAGSSLEYSTYLTSYKFVCLSAAACPTDLVTTFLPVFLFAIEIYLETSSLIKKIGGSGSLLTGSMLSCMPELS